jgi:hypothetical protein
MPDPFLAVLARLARHDRLIGFCELGPRFRGDDRRWVPHLDPGSGLVLDPSSRPASEIIRLSSSNP